MEYGQALDKLKLIKQEHLLCYWEVLSPFQKKELLGQIESLNLSAYQRQKSLLEEGFVHASHTYESWHDYAISGNSRHREEGKKLLKSGQVGCLIIAGGQGSRLRFDGPKGLYPVSLIKQKSLFQLFAEKILAAGKQVGKDLPFAIMTSEQHFEVVKQFFAAHGFFGLKPEQVSFFAQSNLPFLDLKGQLFLEEPGKIAQGPDGNGSVFKSFVDAGIGAKWRALGVRFVNTILVDNVLADPFDAELIGFQEEHGIEVAVKSVFRDSEQEKVGLFVKNRGELQVVEYSEMSAEERTARDSNGALKHTCANLSLFCFAMDFIERVANHNHELPLHPSLKAVKYLSKEGLTELQEKPGAWKFEKFIFDALSYARGVCLLVYQREDCFAPLKNLAGEDSLATVQAALLHRDRKIFRNITGVEVPAGVSFELSQDFHYPTPELLVKWGHATFPNLNYIEM